jgi:hypothetical protein
MQKADVAEYPDVFHDVGLPAIEPPAAAGCHSIRRPMNLSHRYET